MSLYCTVDEVKRILSATKAAPDREDYDQLLLDYINTVSRRIDDLFFADRPLFTPYTETRRFPVNGSNVNSTLGIFTFRDPLLALTSVSASGTALTLSTDYSLYPYSATPPFTQLLLLATSANISSWYTTSATDGTPPYIDITGIWGVHRNYAKAWRSVDALAADISTTTASIFTVANTDGAGWMGLTPRLSAGALVKIDSELMVVQAVNNNTNVCTVMERGANGTTAATHTSAATVYVWECDGAVRQAAARQAALMLARTGAYTAVEVTGAGEVRYPADWLWEVKNMMKRYAYG